MEQIRVENFFFWLRYDKGAFHQIALNESFRQQYLGLD